MIQIKLQSYYALLQQLPSRDNDKNQPGKEWANPQAALIPPDGGAGCSRGKKFPRCGSGLVSGGLQCFLEILRVVKSTRWADTKVPLQGWKL